MIKTKIISYPIIYLVILLLPAFCRYYYSYTAYNFQLLSSILFLSCFSLLIFIIQSRLSYKPLRYLFLYSLFFLIYFLEITEAVSFYLQGSSFNERFFFHFNLDSIKNSWNVYPLMSLLIIIVLLLIGWLLYHIAFTAQLHAKFQAIAGYLVILLLLLSLVFNSSIHYFFDFIWQMRTFQADNTELSKKQLSTLGLNIQAINQTKELHKVHKTDTSKAGKNLVLIYLESIEKIYQDNRVFKGLTPNLHDINQSGLVFNHIQQYQGTGWTIAGIVASQCGTPLLYDYSMISGDDIMSTGFLNKTICLGDVLKQAGYYQSYLGGANKKFAAKVNFLKSHGYDKVQGLSDLKPQLADPSYLTSWGLYDDSLFELAVKEFNWLAKQGKPFNLTLLTLDTHHPSGHASKSCRPYQYQDNSILDAVFCTDQLVKNFIDKISTSPAYKDTIIVLFSDHLAMRNDAEKYYPKAYKRNLTLTILNSKQIGENNNPGTHMDLAPSLLDALQIEHEISFLMGNSLLVANDNNMTEVVQNKKKKKLIKQINSNYLTAKQQGQFICDSDELKRFHKLTNDQAQLIFFDDKGKIYFQDTSDIKSLPHSLYAAKDSHFLLLMPSVKLPFSFANHMDKSKQVQIFLGNLSKKVFYLGGVNTNSPFESIKDRCQKKLSALQLIKETQADNDLLAQICPNKTVNSAFYDRKKQQIIIPAVKVGLEYFRAILKQQTDQSLTLEALDKIAETEMVQGTDFCHANYTDFTLFIPSLQIDNKNFALQLPLKSEGPIRFTIPESIIDKL